MSEVEVIKPENVIVGFTKEFRDKHWQKCRYGLDPRNCGTGVHWPLCVTSCEYKDGVNTCMRDDKPCDAKWKEPVSRF